MRFRSGVVTVVSAGALVFAAPALAAPPNDNLAAAQAISGNAASVAGTTAGATLEAGEPNHFVSGNGSVWYIAGPRPKTCSSTSTLRRLGGRRSSCGAGPPSTR